MINVVKSILITLVLVPFNEVVDNEVPLFLRDLGNAQPGLLQDLHVFENSLVRSVFLQLLERHRLTEFLAELNVDETPLVLLATLARFNKANRARVGRSKVRLVLLDNFNNASDTRVLALGSVEEGEIAQLHRAHVVASDQVTDALPWLGSTFLLQVVDGELGVELASVLQNLHAVDLLSLQKPIVLATLGGRLALVAGLG